MQTLPEMVETCRINCANESYPSDDDLHTAHYQRNAALYDRILATPLVDLEDGPAKISLVFTWYDGCLIDEHQQATIIRIAEDMVRLAGEARP